ncbi:MAG: rod shape-determining protein MreD [bacterium]
MKTFKIVLTVFLAYLLQITVLSRFPVFGVRADILLIITTLFAVTYGAEEGFLMGLLCGLVQDVFGGSFYMHTVSMSLLGFLIGTFKESVFGTEEGVALIAVAVATATYFVLELTILFFFFGRPTASLPVLAMTLFISCLYNSLLAPLIYPAVKFKSKLVME